MRECPAAFPCSSYYNARLSHSIPLLLTPTHAHKHTMSCSHLHILMHTPAHAHTCICHTCTRTHLHMLTPAHAHTCTCLFPHIHSHILTGLCGPRDAGPTHSHTHTDATTKVNTCACLDQDSAMTCGSVC